MRRGPVEKYEEALEDCMDRGHIMEARAIVARQAKLVGCDLRDHESIAMEKTDWREQLLEDPQAFSGFQEAVRLFVEEELNDLEITHQYDVLVLELRKTVNCVKRRLRTKIQEMREPQNSYGLWNRKAPARREGDKRRRRA